MNPIKFVKNHKILTILIICAILLAVFGHCIFGVKDSTEIVIKQSPLGNMSCVEGQGIYLKNFSTIYTFQKARSFYFNSSREKIGGKEWEGDDSDEDDIEVTLSRNSKGWISGYLMYELPTDCPTLLRLLAKHHTDADVKHNLVRNAVMSGISKTAPLFTAEQAKVTSLAEFQALAYSQITNGEYLTETHNERELVSDEERDSSGSITKKAEYAEYKITSLKLDSNGNRIIMNPSSLDEFGIKVTQFQVRNVTLDSVSQDQLDVVKKRETQRVANITEAETAKQLAITNEANGKAAAAKAKWDAEAVKAKVIVQMEQSRDSARLVAERERDVAKLNAERAKYVADSIRAEGLAKADADRAKRAAGLDPLTAANIQKETQIGIAQAIATSPQKWVPEIMIIGGESKSGANPMEAVGMNMLMDIVKKMDK